jgi:hypothetical protein
MPFTDQHGRVWPDAWDTVCPLAEYLGGDKWRFSGTAFYISRAGICLTAAHNFLRKGGSDSTDPKDWIRSPVVVRAIASGENSFRISMVRVGKVHLKTDRLDIAICQAGVGHSEPKPKQLRLASAWPKEGDLVYGYSCPNIPGNVDNVTGKLALKHSDYSGQVTACLPNGRDRTFLPNACFEIKLDAPGGTSGGPIFNAAGHVVGVISTSMAGDPPTTYATPIAPILDMGLEIQTDQGIQELSLRDMGRLGYVEIID